MFALTYNFLLPRNWPLTYSPHDAHRVSSVCLRHAVQPRAVLGGGRTRVRRPVCDFVPETPSLIRRPPPPPEPTLPPSPEPLALVKVDFLSEVCPSEVGEIGGMTPSPISAAPLQFTALWVTPPTSRLTMPLFGKKNTSCFFCWCEPFWSPPPEIRLSAFLAEPETDMGVEIVAAHRLHFRWLQIFSGRARLGGLSKVSVFSVCFFERTKHPFWAVSWFSRMSLNRGCVELCPQEVWKVYPVLGSHYNDVC